MAGGAARSGIIPAQMPASTQGGDPGTDADASLIGTQVGEYLIERRLGEGGMGVVFAGVHPVIKKPVAIKVLQWEIARDPLEVQRLLSEAQVVNAIRHRGIVDVIGFGKLPDDRPYLVMELLDGEPMDALLARLAPLDPVLAVTLLCEMLEALGAAHGVGVVHRDLKPSNVFVVRQAHGDPYVKLLDFGLAKRAPEGTRVTPQTRASVVIGTPDYMAPEQARGRPVSPETDLYAVGCIAFEMLTGRPPFSASTIYEILAMHLTEPAPRVSSLRPDVPPELDELVDRLLRKEPDARPSSASALRQQLVDMRDGWKAAVGSSAALSQPTPTLRSLLESLPPPPVRSAAERTDTALASTMLPAGAATVMSVEVAAPLPKAPRRVHPGVLVAFAAALAVTVAVIVWSSDDVEPPPQVPTLQMRTRAGPAPVPDPSPPPVGPAPSVAPAAASPAPAPAAAPVVASSPDRDAGAAATADERPAKRRSAKAKRTDPFESRQ